MESRNILRPRVTVPAVLLLTVLAVTIDFALSVAIHRAEFCGSVTVVVCLQKAWHYVPWMPMAQLLLAAGAAAVAMIGAPLAPRKALAARLWPLCFLLLLAALLYACMVFARLAAPSMEALRAGTVPTSRRFWFLLAGVSNLPLVLALALAWLAVTRLCLTVPAGAAVTRSRGRLALLFFLVFAAVPMVLFTCLNTGMTLFSTGDYVTVVGAYKNATGIDMEWGIFLACVVAALPVWAVAYLCDSGRRNVAGTLLATSVALVLSFAFALIGLLVIAIFPYHATKPGNLVQTAWLLTIWILVFNTLATLVACMLARPWHPDRRRALRFNAARLVCGGLSAVIAFVTFGFWGVLLAAKLNWVGPQPPDRLLAENPSFAQAASPAGTNCAGIVRAASTLWLLGSNDDDFSDSLSDIVKNPQVRNLALGPGHIQGEPPAYQTFYPAHTVLSRLEGKAFKPVAYVPGMACMVAVPATSRLLLLTSLQPRDSALSPASSLIFQTTDEGRSWQVVKLGMFASVSNDIYQIGIDFRSMDRVWAWRGRFGEAGSNPSGFGFSSDGGRTAEPLPIPADFRSTLSDAANLVPKEARASIKLDDDDGVQRFVTEISPDRAVLWISQRFNYQTATHRSASVARTDALVLDRAGSAWKASAIRHFDDLYIDNLVQPESGPAYAVITHPKVHQASIARLDSAKVQWQRRSAIPDPLWPMGQSQVRGFWATRDALVVDVDAEYTAKKGTAGNSYFDEVSFSADAKYYSNDGGKHWHKLAIASYPGIYGLDRDTSHLYFRNLNRRTYVSPFFAFDLASR